MVTRSSRVRPARTSQPSPPQPARPRRKAPAKPSQRITDEIVGQIIEVSWPGDEKWYKAVVIDYDARHRQHKVIYLEDETIEDMELGSGPGRRGFRKPSTPSDPLIGADIILTDDKAKGTQTWFDFMREDEEDPSPFHVTIFSTVEEPEEDEVTGPTDSGEDARYYRVVHIPNDYLTTVDISCVNYKIHFQPNADQADEQGDQNVKVEKDSPVKVKEPVDEDSKAHSKTKTEDEPDEIEDLDPTADTNATVDPERTVPTVRSRAGRPVRGTQKKVDVAPVEDYDDREFDADPTVSMLKDSKKMTTTRSKPAVAGEDEDGKPEEGATDEKDKDDDFNPAVIEDSDEEAVKPSRSSRRVKDAEAQRVATRGRSARRPSPEIQVDLDDDIRADPLEKDLEEIAAGSNHDDNSAGTHETRDEPVSGRRKREKAPGPVPPKMFPEDFQDEKQHDTASDEEKFGWVPPSGADGDAPLGDGGKKPDKRAPDNRPQVGDFIMLDSGSGGERRKAFVEAYFPETGTHFVAFCDSRGGNVQIKLNNENYSLISDSDVEKMTNSEAILPAEEEEEVEVTRTPRKTRGQGTKRGRQSLTGSGKKKSLKRTADPKILGRSAGAEIVSRCISVLWPGSKLVYVALVMGYSPESRQHILLYMVDHCVETLDLRYREWELLARGTQPWNSSGMVGKRIFVWWPGEYSEQETQELAERIFGDETKVAYEAYVLAYSGKGVYKIIYPCNEDCEERALKLDNSSRSVTDKDWDVLEEGVNEVAGLPVIGWEG